MTHWIAYYRVSTAAQGRSGLGLDAQRAAVTQFLRGDAPAREFIEIESGANNARPQLAAALRECRLRGAKLLVAKLDRLSRNLAFLATLMDSGVEFVACDNPTANRLTVHILAALAEHERSMISTRTREALAAAKARGVALGGRRHDVTAFASKGAAVAARQRQDKAQAAAADMAQAIADVRMALGTEASLRSIAAALTERGIRSPRGAPVTASTVQRALASARLELAQTIRSKDR
jgi:DNA invertase Pin-like site-specific DNA recombinase